jgi:hypothetical protein
MIPLLGAPRYQYMCSVHVFLHRICHLPWNMGGGPGGGVMFKDVGAATPTQIENHNRKNQIFTIFAPPYCRSLHPQCKMHPRRICFSSATGKDRILSDLSWCCAFKPKQWPACDSVSDNDHLRIATRSKSLGPASRLSPSSSLIEHGTMGVFNGRGQQSTPG